MPLDQTPISVAFATAPQNGIRFAPLIHVSLNNFVFELEEVSSRPPLPKADKTHHLSRCGANCKVRSH